MHGFGRLIYTSGEYYIGNFNQGKRHGDGKFFSKTNVKQEDGKWISDKFEGDQSKPMQFNKSPDRKKTLTQPPKKLAANVDRLYSGKPIVTKANEQKPTTPSGTQKPFMNSFSAKK